MIAITIDRKTVEQALSALECGDSNYPVVVALRTALEQPAPSVEPVSYEYQTRDGKWSPFINKKHYEDTVADGSWPIRALYTSQPDTAAQIAELQADLREVEANFEEAINLWSEERCFSQDLIIKNRALQAKFDVARSALEEWDALIKHQYTGTREGMSDLTYAAQGGAKALEAIK